MTVRVQWISVFDYLINASIDCICHTKPNQTKPIENKSSSDKFQSAAYMLVSGYVYGLKSSKSLHTEKLLRFNILYWFNRSIASLFPIFFIFILWIATFSKFWMKKKSQPEINSLKIHHSIFWSFQCCGCNITELCATLLTKFRST